MRRKGTNILIETFCMYTFWRVCVCACVSACAWVRESESECVFANSKWAKFAVARILPLKVPLTSLFCPSVSERECARVCEQVRKRESERERVKRVSEWETCFRKSSSKLFIFFFVSVSPADVFLYLSSYVSINTNGRPQFSLSLPFWWLLLFYHASFLFGW